MNNHEASSSEATVIEDNNLSHAWGRVLSKALKPGVTKISPLVINLTGFDPDLGPDEDPEIRSALDKYTQNKGLWSVENVAFTIFPKVYWDMAGGNRDEFFQNCLDAAPSLRKMQVENSSGKPKTPNSLGLYFERLMNYGADSEEYDGKLNQLKTIIENYEGGTHRASMLQATTYNPFRDLTKQPRRGFPCLQHVTFVPGKNDLALNAFYATQFLVGRAYGNLLGLAHLGAFMAEALGKKLTRVTVFAGVEDLGAAKTDNDMKALAQSVEDALKN